LINLYVNEGKVTKLKETLFDCAYNFPAVAYCLRAENWEIIQPVFVRLSESNDQ